MALKHALCKHCRLSNEIITIKTIKKVSVSLLSLWNHKWSSWIKQEFTVGYMFHITQCTTVWVDCNSFPPKAGERKFYISEDHTVILTTTFRIVLDISKLFRSTNIIYHMSNSHECMGVNGKALQLCIIYKKPYFFITSHARICIRYCKFMW